MMEINALLAIHFPKESSMKRVLGKKLRFAPTSEFLRRAPIFSDELRFSPKSSDFLRQAPNFSENSDFL